MDLVTVYKAFRKQAAGSSMPGMPGGSQFKVDQLPGMKPIQPITAPGSVPLDQPQAPEAAPQQPQQGVDAKMLEKGWEKTMDAMQNITAMNNGMEPQTGAGTPAQQPAGAGVPGQQIPGADGVAPQPLPKMASANYGTIYKSMKKRALFDGEDWQTWMLRKDTMEPGAWQHLRAQDNGAVTSFLTSLLAGGALGYGANKLFDKGEHTTAGAIGGAATLGGLAMLMNLVGKGAGYVTPTRTAEQHQKYQDSGTAAEWLIPGVANYNKVKTYGRALHGQEKDMEEEAKRQEAQLPKAASWLGRQVNNVFGSDTWMGRTFGESADTAARNFFNSQISPEMQAKRKADAAEVAKQVAAHQQRINRNIDRMVAEMQQGKKRPANTAIATTAKQKSPARG